MDFTVTPEQEAIRTAIAKVCAAFDLDYWLQKDHIKSEIFKLAKVRKVSGARAD